ncbi:MAG: DUF6261 family protein [Tannerellaceae bacterium]|jgi:hypothetical protein|nr:DUF6261 family protein [Tannerellaceae bacterium]
MKAIRISIHQLHNEEWFDLHTKYKGTVNVHGSENIGLKKLMDSYDPVYLTADGLLQVIRKSAYTSEVATADKHRKTIFRGLTTVTKGSLNQPLENKQKAAIRVFNVLQVYRKSVLDSTYSEASGALHNLLQDLSGPRAADITLLGLGDWTNALTQAEQAFQDVYGQRHDESVGKPKEDFKTVRVQLDTLYNAAIDILDAQLLIDGLGGDTLLNPDNETSGEESGPTEDGLPIRETSGNAIYDFMVDWNETLKKFQNMLHQRAGRRAKNKSENPDDSDDSDDSNQPVED